MALAVGVYLLLAGAVLGLAAYQAIDGQRQLRALERDLSPADLLDGTGQQRLRSAEARFDSASAWLGSPVMAPLRLVPVLGAQVRSVEALADGVGSVTRIARQGIGEADALVADGVPQGEQRASVMRELGAVADGMAADLAGVDLDRGAGVLWPLTRVHEEAVEDKDGIEDALLRSGDAASALATLFEGPSDYLLLAANNSEMRAGSGMLLSAGVLHAEDGELTVGELEPSADNILASGVGIGDEDIEALWGFAGPDQDFRNLLLSPRLEPNAAMAVEMWAALGRPDVDGVLVLDVRALQGLLGAIGAVIVDDQEYNRDNVIPLLLHDQYVGVADDEQGERRDVLADVAKAVLEEFDTSSPDLAALAEAMRVGARGRHLLLWSRDAQAQSAWEGIEVAGQPQRDGLLLSVLNEGGNKLDQFLEVRGEVEPGADPGTARVTVEVTNTVGDDEPEYIAGGDPEAEVAYGVYPGYLSLTAPAGTAMEVVVGPEADLGGPDGNHETVAARMRIRPGATKRWVVDLTLAPGSERLRVLPTARVPPVEWTVAGETWSERRIPARSVELAT